MTEPKQKYDEMATERKSRQWRIVHDARLYMRMEGMLLDDFVKIYKEILRIELENAKKEWDSIND